MTIHTLAQSVASANTARVMAPNISAATLSVEVGKRRLH